MSSLTDVEKRYLEKTLNMQSGWVLDYSDATFGGLFNHYKIDIHSARYQKYGTSKAKKLRAFWEVEPDDLVGSVLSEMLDSYEAGCHINNSQVDQVILEKSREAVARLTGKKVAEKNQPSVDEFLHNEFKIPSLHKLPIEPQVLPIIEKRLEEARVALAAGAYLSVIFLCGSVLEAVLLGAAQKDPRSFNSTNASPKAVDGTVKRLHEWTLTQFIDAACEIDLLKPDVKRFSEGLRDFRNYIHPYQQLVSGFTPDEHTAKVCFQVLKAALASIAGERK